MSVFILIALFNRTLNGKLAQNSNAFYSSLINHLVGFIFLTIFVLWVKDYHAIELSTIPLIAFAGGIIGAFFVVINSYVLPLLGVMLTSVLAICGQMISSLVIDIFSGIESNNLLLQIIGVLLIIGGVLIKFTKQSK
ncbi:DMT family transporter [Proteus terrae]|uniref:DMT family transporter n=1 Tax=Proteus terrae TaxID=1574161 RepID=UPI0021A3C2F7|nr:DMT family transporter [Proteus terrae]